MPSFSPLLLFISRYAPHSHSHPHTLIIFSLLIYGNLRMAHILRAHLRRRHSLGVSSANTQTLAARPGGGGGQSAVVSSVMCPCPCPCPASAQGRDGHFLLRAHSLHTFQFRVFSFFCFFLNIFFPLPHNLCFRLFIHSLLFCVRFFFYFSNIHIIFFSLYFSILFFHSHCTNLRTVRLCFISFSLACFVVVHRV